MFPAFQLELGAAADQSPTYVFFSECTNPSGIPVSGDAADFIDEVLPVFLGRCLFSRFRISFGRIKTNISGEDSESLINFMKKKFIPSPAMAAGNIPLASATSKKARRFSLAPPPQPNVSCSS